MIQILQPIDLVGLYLFGVLCGPETTLNQDLVFEINQSLPCLRHGLTSYQVVMIVINVCPGSSKSEFLCVQKAFDFACQNGHKALVDAILELYKKGYFNVDFSEILENEGNDQNEIYNI